MFCHHVAVFLLALSSLSCAAELRGRVAWNDKCGDHKELGHAKVILNDGTHYGNIVRNGGWAIPHVEPGTYILTVQSKQHVFDSIRVDIPANDDIPEIRPHYPGTPLNPPVAATLPYPIILHPRQKNSFFVPPEFFDPMGMFKNPMILMMGATALMAIGLPWMLKNMDPETLKDVSDQHEKLYKMKDSLSSKGLGGVIHDATTNTDSDAEKKDRTPKGKGKGRRR